MGFDPNINKMELVEEAPARDLLWEVYSKDGDLKIDAITGEMEWIFNSKAVPEGENVSEIVKSHISQDNAITIAQRTAKELGLYIPESTPLAELAGGHSSKIGDVWLIKWPREIQGYKFHDDFVLVNIDAYKGTFIGYNKTFDSKEPPTLDIRIDKLKAAELASDVTLKKNLTLKPDSAKLMIINPNYRWTDSFVPLTDESRLAWVIEFDKAEGYGEIWIDASTGEMLGGEETR